MRLDCGAIPIPTKMTLYKDIKPINQVDGWFLSHEDYKKLANNMIEIKRYLKELRVTLSAYKDCVDNYNNKADS